MISVNKVQYAVHGMKQMKAYNNRIRFTSVPYGAVYGRLGHDFVVLDHSPLKLGMKHDLNHLKVDDFSDKIYYLSISSKNCDKTITVNSFLRVTKCSDKWSHPGVDFMKFIIENKGTAELLNHNVIAQNKPLGVTDFLESKIPLDRKPQERKGYTFYSRIKRDINGEIIKTASGDIKSNRSIYWGPRMVNSRGYDNPDTGGAVIRNDTAYWEHHSRKEAAVVHHDVDSEALKLGKETNMKQPEAFGYSDVASVVEAIKEGRQVFNSNGNNYLYKNENGSRIWKLIK